MRLDCGIQRKRIEAWLQDELKLERQQNFWTFFHGDATCRITVEPNGSSTFAGVSLERTAVEMRGDDEATEELYRRFTLRFLSAGG